jgi:predicted DNA-binding transcriptional regulator AlpA
MEVSSFASLLTTSDAARLLGYSPRALENWRYRGGGPRFVRVSAKSVRYRRADLDTWIEERLRVSTSDDGRPE